MDDTIGNDDLLALLEDVVECDAAESADRREPGREILGAL